MFASQITKEVVLDGDERVTVRKLSALTLDRARAARQADQAKTLRNYGGELLKAIRSESLDDVAEAVAARRADPAARRKAHYDEFDRETVLNAGIVSWTADRKVNPESIGDLDEPSAQKLHEEIVDLSNPFDADAAREAEGKS